MKAIAFFSSCKELEILKKQDYFNSILLVALTPEADLALEKFPSRRKTIEDYYSEKTLNITGNSSLEKVQEICDFIDANYFSPKQKFSCSDVYMFVKLLHDQLLINHTFCKAVLEQEKPKKIILFDLPRLSETILSESNDDLLINFIHYFFYQINQIECEILHLENDIVTKKDNFLFSFFSSYKKTLSTLKFKCENQLFRLVNFNKPSIYILQHYDFEVCKKFRREFKLYWQFKKNLQLRFQQLVSKKPILTKRANSSCQEHIEKMFAFEDISYYSLIELKLNFLINTLPDTFDHLVSHYMSLFTKKKIRVVISASGQSLKILSGIAAADFCNIPVIWGQHGGFYGYADFPITKYLNRHYSHYFLYTDACSVVNGGVSCFTVSNSKLIHLYRKKRLSNEF